MPVDISNEVVSDKKTNGSITNSNLEMAAILLQWGLLELIAPTHHRLALSRSENLSSYSWATQMSPESTIAARLAWALALRQRLCQAAPMSTMHVVGKANDIANIPSRSFREGHCWNCPTNFNFLTCFNEHFCLPHGGCWQLCVINPKIVTLVTLELQTRWLPMDVWKQLLARGRLFELPDADTLIKSELIPILPMKTLQPLCDRLPDFLDGLGAAITLEDARLLVQGCKLQLEQLIRPARWKSKETLYTTPLSNI